MGPYDLFINMRKSVGVRICKMVEEMGKIVSHAWV